MKFFLIGLVLLIGLGYGSSKAYIHYQVSDKVDSVIPVISPYMDLQYGGISSTLTGELTIDDVVIRVNGYRDAIEIGRLGINTPSYLDLVKLSRLSANSGTGEKVAPEYFGLLAENIRVSTSADYYHDYYDGTIKALAPSDIRQGGVQCVGKYGYSPRAFKALGYEELVMSMSMIMRQADSYFNTEMEFDIVDMIDVDIDVSMEGGVMESAVMGSAYQPRLRNLQLKLTDNSLKQRVVKYCTELGLTSAQILRAHINALQYAGSNFGIEFDKHVIDPYREFLTDKSTFVATANPREPIYLSKIRRYKPIDVPALLNLEAIAR